jgi:ribosome-associated protein
MRARRSRATTSADTTEVLHGAPSEDDRHDRPSKTQRKKQSHALQALGERLVALAPEKLARMPIDEPLRDAVRQAQRITSHEGRRRQLQYIGRLMREADAQAIADAFAVDDAQHRGVVGAMHAAERWRDGLIDASLELRDFEARYPAAAASPLVELVSGARRERAEDRPPRDARTLFRELHRIIADHELERH